MLAGDTNDASTLPAVPDDLAARFALRRICVVTDHATTLFITAGLDTRYRPDNPNHPLHHTQRQSWDSNAADTQSTDQ